MIQIIIIRYADMIAIGEANLRRALILTAPQPEERAA